MILMLASFHVWKITKFLPCWPRASPPTPEMSQAPCRVDHWTAGLQMAPPGEWAEGPF